jgi:PncC family amidohydrolase
MNFNQDLIDQTQKLFELALKNNIKIVSAESCTGGLFSSLITEFSGSSKIFECGFVVYSNESKNQNLGVNLQTINNFGAVSEQVAKEMAIGAIKNSNANLSIAITGIAGPDGGSKEKPVGLVYIASFYSLNQNLIVKEFNFLGDRKENRMLTIKNALQILISQINV